MDKQELARRLFSIADDLRGSIEAYNYKDYILGLLFYKVLSDKEYSLLSKDLGLSDEEIYAITESNKDLAGYAKDKIGYFIEPKNFYRNWLDNIDKFTEDDLIISLSAFERNIPDSTKHVFGGIFDTISRNLTTLAPTSMERTKSLKKLLIALRDIPTANTDYDIIGYVYEYLISQFSAGAGKKGGEFFTPAEVSTAIARIVYHNLKDRETITVFDPTVGSGSLLLAVGKTFEKSKQKKNKVKYFYQEKTDVTYDMCRQNLAMRGVMPANMVGRNGDTLGLDYPYFSDEDPDGTYEPVFVDAVVSNPPYSQKYDPEPIRDSARFAEYGLPPASKADYAFLLHGLYHLKSDGVQVIVLPHGVLFRNEELGIRTKLIKKHQIEAIIGLPANVFFGTGIPTTFLVLKKQRDDDSILFIDASKGFVKDGNKNKLREADIQRIVDAYIQRKDIEKYARVVSYKEVEENDFNLNISRYISSEDDPEIFDAFGLMHGAIPVKELEEKFNKFWRIFPELYGELFDHVGGEYVSLKTDEIIDTVRNNASVKKYILKYNEAVESIIDEYKNYIFISLSSIDLSRAQFEIKAMIFEALKEFELIDKYSAYQEFFIHWTDTELDIEELHLHGLDAAREVDEVMKIVKKKEVFDYWEGRIIPFKYIQEKFFKEEKARYEELEARKEEIKAELDSLVSALDEEDAIKVLKDDKDEFSVENLKSELAVIYDEVTSPELEELKAYMKLLDSKANKKEKLDFISKHNNIAWSSIDKNKDGTVSKANITKYYKSLQAKHKFEEDSFADIIIRAKALKDEESSNNKESKELKKALQDKSVEATKHLKDSDIYELLEMKWLLGLEKDLKGLLFKTFNDFENELNEINQKYGISMKSLEAKEKKLNRELKEELEKLEGTDADMLAIKELMDLLGDI